MTRWLCVIGIGEDGYAALPAATRALVDRAEFLVGGERHLAMVPAGKAARIEWESPLRLTVERILSWRGRRVVVLATGDPLWFGVGVTLARSVGMDEMSILPAPSAFQLAAARLGWALAEVDCLTLHGRPLDSLNEAAQPGRRLLLLAHDGATPAAVARRLVELRLGPSRVVVLEHMGGPDERLVEATAETFAVARAADLNTIAVEVRAQKDARARARVAGLPDDAFRHDGQITKREVRAATIALLAPLPGELLWDVGAGSGSIAIEWLRADRSLQAIAIEREASRAAAIEANASALGVPRLDIRVGEAPACLAGLPAPDAVFIGGGLSRPGLVEACWQALKSGGRLVANAVTLDGEARLARLQAEIGGELARIAVARAEKMGAHVGWRALAPVTQFVGVKP